MKRAPFITRTIRLVGEEQRKTARVVIDNLPVDAEHPLEIVIREEVRKRGLDANACYWKRLTEISEQAWIDGRRFSAEVFHEHYKQTFLPEDDDPELPILVKDSENWKKWDFTPTGARVCVGSTTRLTKLGFSRYLEQVMAHGAQLGVIFTERMAA